MKKGLNWAVVSMLVVLSTSGCVNHYCGPAYPNSTDPFCYIHHPAPPN